MRKNRRHVLVVTAIVPAGVVEAAEHSYLFIHLVQWHPERMLARSDSMLPFVDGCRSR